MPNCRLLLLGILAWISVLHAADFATEMRQADLAVKGIKDNLSALLQAGDVATANATLLAVFPEAQRTPAQAFLLGNMLFDLDPAQAYILHQQVAKQKPNDFNIQFEWALEQHRQREFAGALATYDRMAVLDENFAPAHGLAAHCLMALNQPREAVARWRRSEQAKQGSLEDFESLVCAVAPKIAPLRQRAELRTGALGGDHAAVVDLVLYDCQVTWDWWNAGPDQQALTFDLPLLDTLGDAHGDSSEGAALRCLASCMLEEEPTPENLRAMCRSQGLIFDDQRTLPQNPRVAGLLLRCLLSNKALSEEQIRRDYQPALLALVLKTALAQESTHGELWDIIVLCADATQTEELERQAWQATGQPRFAVGCLTARGAQDPLSVDDKDLVQALSDFPQSADVLAIAIAAAGKPDAALYQRAILAEYEHFSLQGGLGWVTRPGARPLRHYYAELAKLLLEVAP